MSRALLVLAGALLLGFGIGEYLTRNLAFRQSIARLIRHEELRALVGRHGIYDRDVTRAWEAELFARGAAPQEVENAIAREEKRALLDRLITLEKLHKAAASEAVKAEPAQRAMNLLRWQMPDEKTWQERLRYAAISPRQLRGEINGDLGARQSIEDQIAPRLQPNEEECRRYFATHRASFEEPVRLRASHLFLAAPDGYPTEVIETKSALINRLAQRLANGEAFPALVAEFSEDEATRKRGGDLGYFAAERMLPAVFAAAQRLRPGETSAPVRSPLGFHLIRLTESRPARTLTFEEARPEISMHLENQRRAAAVAEVVAALR